MDESFLEGVGVKNESELRQAWEGIERMFAVILFDRDGMILYANPVFCQATGYAIEELTGQHHKMLCLPAYVESPDYIDFWEKLRSGNKQHGTFHRRRKDGRDLFLYAEYTPIFDTSGNIVKVLKIAQNTSRVAEHLIQQLGMSENLIGRLLTM